MRNQKLLATAIAAALSLTVSTTAMAGTFNLTNSAGALLDSTNGYPSGYPIYAVELMNESSQDLTYNYRARYILAEKLVSPIKVTYTLSSGGWRDNLHSGVLTLQKADGSLITNTPNIAVSITDKGLMDENSVTFNIEVGDELATNSIVAGEVLDFQFKIGDATVLADSGSQIKLDVEIQLGANPALKPDTAESMTVASSGRGVNIRVNANDATGIAIDVAQGGTNFVGGITPTMISLGDLEFTNPSPQLYEADGESAYSFDTSSVAGSLTIENGIFSASSPNTENVFIDIDGNNTISTPDIRATSLTTDQAVFNMDKNDTAAIFNPSGKNIIVVADGTNPIDDLPDAPLATLTMKFQKESTIQGKLLHVKQNGTVCTLYNVPSSAATDAVSIKITNKGIQAGIVRGRLVALDGTHIMESTILIESLAPNQTFRLSATDLEDIQETATGTRGWSGRAVLDIGADLKKMEVYGLLRNKLGGPLMNLSTGGSGNGCD
ncbi:hypothetical protein [Candidatus Parabeggiatoa sp. HSG14]|uniref:hypothetical protein n=1 Tax=Candidatus Parabeggiatoa sp. HSG14 TaxID=3055593 RepID=UPI0025A8F691|nr:hypothetical protein [Thiotrichales bacterium HSG14]